MKKIRSNFVKETLLDYDNLTKTLKENTSSAVKDLLSETVRETYAKLLSEKEGDEEYEEEEVEDTASEIEPSEEPTEETDLESGETELDDELSDNEEGENLEDLNGNEEDGAVEESEGDEWADFEKYKISDEEYDFSEAQDDEIVKVYKLLKDDDQVLVNVDKAANKVELKDNESGTEYLIDLGSDEDFDVEDDLELDNEENMTNESIIYEIALNEYDSHVGYTDNYQKKDVMTNPGMSEPGKNVNSWDAGVPKGSEKPWAKPNKKASPFSTSVNEEDVVEPMDEEDEMVEELKTVGEHGANIGSTSRTDGPNNPRKRKARNFHTAERGQETSTSDNAYGVTAESRMMKKAEKIFKENRELKTALAKFKNVLKEAAVTNLNLGQIIKLISENSTTKAEKQEIIKRFGREANTIAESKRLFATISDELKKNNTMNINEERQFTTSGSQMINETQIYQSNDLLGSLDLMHRICK